MLSHDLMAILQKNGLDAEVIIDAQGAAVLNVRGNRGYATSPPLTYKLTPRQLDTLVNARGEGTGVRLKNAYNTFNSIVGKDFTPPQSYQIAFNVGIDRSGGRNRLTPVNMGWNGVADRRSRGPYAPYVLRDQRVDGSLKPGETAAMRHLPNGMYVPTAGYVWKGGAQQVQQQASAEQQRPVVVDIAPMAAPRPEDGKATLLKDHVSTAGNDTYAMLDDILRTHGIVIQEGKDEKGNPEKQLVLMAKNAKVNITYHLTEEEYRKLTADGWLSKGETSLDRRLEIINSKIGLDFKEPVNRDMLNTSNYVDLSYKEGRREVNEERYIQYEERQRRRQEDERELKAIQEWAGSTRRRIHDDPNAIDGRDVSSILKGQAFYFDGNSHARQITVGEIRVDSTSDSILKEIDATRQVIERDRHMLAHPENVKVGDGINEMSRDDIIKMLPEQIERLQGQLEMLERELKNVDRERYTMTAEVNGERKTIDISEKEYRRFLDYDDQHRLKMFADKFSVSIDKGQDDSWRIVKTSEGYITEGRLRTQQTWGASVNENILQQLGKGFYAEQRGGRQKDVSNIVVYDLNNPVLNQQDKVEVIRELGIKDVTKDHYIIAADIDGKTVVRTMTARQYDEYMKSDDIRRMKIADHVFDEFKIKNIPGSSSGAGKKILGILGGLAGVAVAGLAVKHDIEHPHHRPHIGTPPLHAPAHALNAAQQSLELFEQITEDVAMAPENISNGIHK